MERRADESIEEFSRRVMEGFLDERAHLAETPVDLAAHTSYADLDDHLWVRVSGRAPRATAAEVTKLHDDVRAYYVTRLFEWASDLDGPLAFFEQYSELVQFVEDGYRHLGLPDAADAFEHCRSSEAVQRELSGRGQPSDVGLQEAQELVDAIGGHDDDRLAFVRAHPTSFKL